MPSPLDEEEIEEILDTFEDCETIAEADEKLDHHYNTINKYVSRAYEEGDSRVEHYGEADEPGEDHKWDGAGPGESPFGPDDEFEDEREYVGLSPGDFIEEFFDDFEVGIKKKWVRIQARRADRRNMIPSKEALKQDILRMKSGIAQGALVEAEYIAEEYWAEAQEYCRQTGRDVDRTAASGNTTQPGQLGVGFGGGVGQQHEGFTGQPAGSQPQPGMDPQAQMFQMMMQQMQQMQQEVQKLRSQPPQASREVDTLSRLQELEQEKEILERLSGGDEHLERVEAQIQQLQQQQMQSQAEHQPAMPSGDASFEDRLLDLAVNDPSVDAKEIIEVLEERMEKSQDPALVEKQFEKEIKEMELKQQSERMERIGGLAENVMHSLGQGFAARLAEPSGDDDEAVEETSGEEALADESAPADGFDPATQPPQPATPAVRKMPCEHCEGEMTVAGNQAACPDCEAGVSPCDICSHPVDIPPVGEAEYSRCGQCENVLEVPDDPSDEVECDECEWEGKGDQLRGELLQCEGCDNFRPIVRAAQMEQQREQVAD